MDTKYEGINKDANIVIVGAGPAGLSTAWYLSKNGFHNVTVLEKLGRVGGLCKSITVGELSFDIGANYVTWAYKDTLAIAKEVGAKTYAEEPYTSLEVDPSLEKKPNFRPLKEAILFNYYTQEKVSKAEFALAAVRYLYLRWKLRKIIDKPGYLDDIHEHTELCISFRDWLEKHNLMALSAMFQFPITIMGYGELDNLATPYALRYMSLKTVLPMVFGSWIVNFFIGKWPRRFTMGFQRLWEAVAWRTNVRLNVNIQRIERTNNKIIIDVEYPRQELNKIEIVEGTLEYDYLILACPLTDDVFDTLKLKRNEKETTITDKIRYKPYCMTTCWVNNMNMPEPIAPIMPIPDIGKPWAIARQFQHENNHFTQFYTMDSKLDALTADNVKDNVEKLIKLLEGKIDDTKSRWHTFDKFTYFQHFVVADIEQGIYKTLADMQGNDRTYYVGGATDFELVEPIVNHSKYIIEKHFVARTSDR